MDEYIKREAAIEAIMSEPPDAHYPQWYAEKIKSIPAADVAPVVRCWECKHIMFSDCYGECGKGHMGIVSQNDFCSYGERKEGAE